MARLCLISLGVAIVILAFLSNTEAARLARSPQLGAFSQAQAGTIGGSNYPRPQFGAPYRPGGFGGYGQGQGVNFVQGPSSGQGVNFVQGPGFGQGVNFVPGPNSRPGLGNQRGPVQISVSKSISINRGPGGAQASSSAGSFGK